MRGSVLRKAFVEVAEQIDKLDAIHCIYRSKREQSTSHMKASGGNSEQEKINVVIFQQH